MAVIDKNAEGSKLGASSVYLSKGNVSDIDKSETDVNCQFCKQGALPHKSVGVNVMGWTEAGDLRHDIVDFRCENDCNLPNAFCIGKALDPIDYFFWLSVLPPGPKIAFRIDIDQLVNLSAIALRAFVEGADCVGRFRAAYAKVDILPRSIESLQLGG